MVEAAVTVAAAAAAALQHPGKACTMMYRNPGSDVEVIKCRQILSTLHLPMHRRDRRTQDGQARIIVVVAGEATEAITRMQGRKSKEAHFFTTSVKPKRGSGEAGHIL